MWEWTRELWFNWYSGSVQKNKNVLKTDSGSDYKNLNVLRVTELNLKMANKNKFSCKSTNYPPPAHSYVP